MKGTVYRGRAIPLAWQIEFEPVGPAFEVANEKLSTLGLDPDGYGWATLIKGVADKYHPCLLYTSPSPRDGLLSRMPSSA